MLNMLAIYAAGGGIDFVVQAWLPRAAAASSRARPIMHRNAAPALFPAGRRAFRGRWRMWVERDARPLDAPALVVRAEVDPVPPAVRPDPRPG